MLNKFRNQKITARQAVELSCKTGRAVRFCDDMVFHPTLGLVESKVVTVPKSAKSVEDWLVRDNPDWASVVNNSIDERYER